jgi:hypothetical protein
MGEWRYSSTLLNLSTKWEGAVSFTLRSLYSQGKSPRYLLGRRLGGSQSRSGLCGEEKNLAPAGNRTRTIPTVSRRYTN